MYSGSEYLYTTGLWDAAAAMLIGMGSSSLGVFSAARSYRFYVVMALVGLLRRDPLGIWVSTDWMRHGFEAGARWASLDDLTRMASHSVTWPWSR